MNRTQDNTEWSVKWSDNYCGAGSWLVLASSWSASMYDSPLEACRVANGSNSSSVAWNDYCAATDGRRILPRLQQWVALKSTCSKQSPTKRPIRVSRFLSAFERLVHLACSAFFIWRHAANRPTLHVRRSPVHETVSLQRNR